jgi:hypothetical protein
MASLYLYILGIAFAIVTVSYFALDHKQRTLLLSRFGLDRQPWAPQLSPSTAKRELSEKRTLPAGQEYKDTFPPSRRPALAELTDNRFSVGGKSGKGLSELPHKTDKSLPDDRNVLAPQYKKYTTPTGFTVEEIKALGNFPDYATLSGVHLPTPYTDFDIKTALSRPYRPFRWPYHQTMCKCCLLPAIRTKLTRSPTKSIQKTRTRLVARTRQNLHLTYKTTARLACQTRLSHHPIPPRHRTSLQRTHGNGPPIPLLPLPIPLLHQPPNTNFPQQHPQHYNRP